MLKPQDLLVLLKLEAHSGARPTYAALGESLGLSAAEIVNVVRRSMEAGLATRDRRELRPLRPQLHELLVHGVRYVFPARRGAKRRGVPTGASAPPLSEVLTRGDEMLVWPHLKGSARGESIEPLYATAPDAALHDPALYRRLALVDALRVGGARERKLAADLLAKEMGL